RCDAKRASNSRSVGSALAVRPAILRTRWSSALIGGMAGISPWRGHERGATTAPSFDYAAIWPNRIRFFSQKCASTWTSSRRQGGLQTVKMLRKSKGSLLFSAIGRRDGEFLGWRGSAVPHAVDELFDRHELARLGVQPEIESDVRQTRFLEMVQHLQQ